MDEQSFSSFTIFTGSSTPWLFTYRKPKRFCKPTSRQNCRYLSFNCIKVSWCVFFLVTVPVNVFSQSTIKSLHISQPEVLVNEALRYRMLSGAIEVGEMLVNINHDPRAGVLHITESTSGLFERTTTLLLQKDSTLKVLASHTIMTKESFSQEIQLLYKGENITGTIVPPKTWGETRQINTPLSADVQDYYSVPYFLRSCALQVNQVIKFPIYEAVRNRAELARGWVVKLEEVETPVGKFTCYRVEGFTGKLRWILHFDKEFPHRLIKQKLPALSIEAELIAVAPTS